VITVVADAPVLVPVLHTGVTVVADEGVRDN